MRRIPVTRLAILPTLIVVAAVAVMIGLGVWQVRRATWKDGLIAQYRVAPGLPVVDLDPLLRNGNPGAVPLAFRRVLVTCRSGDAAPSLRGGRGPAGQGGYSLFLPCRPGADGLAGRIAVNAGWTDDPQSRIRPRLDGVVAGALGAVEGSGPVILTSASPSAGLQPSAPPALDNIPNNHMMYAVQWFAFAATALVIYALALRRRGRGGRGDRGSVAPDIPTA